LLVAVAEVSAGATAGAAGPAAGGTEAAADDVAVGSSTLSDEDNIAILGLVSIMTPRLVKSRLFQSRNRDDDDDDDDDDALGHSPSSVARMKTTDNASPRKNQSVHTGLSVKVQYSTV
jgi:hypothetical protein